MSTIDKVKLYPFSPLKLLHETRKLTAAQAKFFVALMCLYFERYGNLEFYNVDGSADENAAAYAPYCGVTKKTFIKMINALEAAGVIDVNESGYIDPIIAKEIQDAVDAGTYRVNGYGEFETAVPQVPVAPVATFSQEEAEAAKAAGTFRAEPQTCKDNQGSDEPNNKQDGALTPISKEREEEIKQVNAQAKEYARAIGKDDDFFNDEKTYNDPPSVRRAKFLNVVNMKRSEVLENLAKLNHSLPDVEIAAQIEEAIMAYIGTHHNYDFAICDLKLEQRELTYAKRAEADAYWDKVSKRSKRAARQVNA